MGYLGAINETSYLSVPNAPVYRKIMRCFYREYEKMHFQLYKDNQSVYEEIPAEFLLKPHTRNYREKKSRNGFTDKSVEKMMQRKQYLDRAEKQKEIVMHYIKNGKIVFSEIEDVISADTFHDTCLWLTFAHRKTMASGI